MTQHDPRSSGRFGRRESVCRAASRAYLPRANHPVPLPVTALEKRILAIVALLIVLGLIGFAVL